jgi:hypothetical protein
VIDEEEIESFLGGDRVRLKPGVRRVRRPGALLLLPPGGNPVMVSPMVDEIWDLLVAGVQVSELASELRERRPRARDVASKLTVFLNRLWNAGLLEGSGACALPSPSRIEIPIDPLARACASLLRRVPRPLFVAVIVGFAAASLCGLLVLLVSAKHPRMSNLPEHLTVEGVLIIVFLLIPLHELGHAAACRFAGVASGPAGIRFGRLGIPHPYVVTSLAWGIEQATRRCWIPAGGPLVDLFVGGAAAWGLVVFDPPGVLGSVVWLVALYALIAVNVGTSPIPVGDGSHLLEALLDDEFARGAALLWRRNRFVRPHSVRIYRLVCIGHVICSTALLYVLR